MASDFDAQFRQKGFLADAIGQVVTELRQRNAEWFLLADALNECIQSIAMRAVETVRGSTLAPNVLATFVLLRSTSMVQATILLIERGMAVEARLVIRSLLENAFCIAALHDSPSKFIDMFKADDAASRRGQANVILKKGLADPSSAAGKKLSKLLADIEKKGVRNFSIPDLADLGPLHKQYLHYRVLSNDAAHPSATSLRRHLNKTPGRSSWQGYKLGPATDADIAECLGYLILSVIPIGVGFTQMVEDKVGNAELASISNRYGGLSKE